MKINDISPYNFVYSYPRIWIKYILIAFGFGLLLFSLYSVATDDREDRTLWLIDTSLSMVAQDVKGEGDIVFSRLDLAKAIVASGRTMIPGSHALMTFGDTARLILPFTHETDIFTSTVRGLQSTIYSSTTDIEAALQSADLLYGSLHPRIIVLTDGEQTVEQTELVEDTSQKHPDITFIGIGTEAGGPMLQGYDAAGIPRYKQYEGKNAISQLDIPNLKTLSQRLEAKLIVTHMMNDTATITANLGGTISTGNLEDTDTLLILAISLILLGLMLPGTLTRR